jgi:predicted aldo/keto reductase-like oxidoreductase
MPVFSCGGMRYQDGWKDKSLDDVSDESQTNLDATIRRSVELGINHIETARGYGCSERQLGRVLPSFDRDQLIVQTKIGPTDDPDQFVMHFGQSLDRLQLDYVDLLAIHGVNNDETLEKSIRPGGCLAAARRLQKMGKAKHIGFSTHGPVDVITRAINHPNDGGFDYVNLHWYYIFERNWSCIEAATQKDMGVFIISPSDKGGKLYEPSDKLRELCSPLHPITFNDLWCLRQQKVHTLSVGAARPSDFNEHVDAVPYLDDIDSAIGEIEQRLAAAFTDAIEPELRNPFDGSLPDFDTAPGGINLPIIIWLRNLAKAFDMTVYGKMRYNMLGNGGHWFPGTKADQLAKDDYEAKLRPLLADHPLGADRLIAILRETDAMIGGEEKKRLSEGE